MSVSHCHCLPFCLLTCCHCCSPLSSILFSNTSPCLLPIQPLWRFTNSPVDGRLLVYRSEDIRNLSRIASPKVCGYVHAEAKDLLPQTARRYSEVEQEKGEPAIRFPL